ncbi:MAG TPA: glycosyltransferase family 2 protein [Casimicrobiaceae bacterium]|nr:glycosyltransferase family 2 protein [Casimicrobiaceae bacterium]
MATRYSLVVPVYRNEAAIPALVAALADLHRELGGALEVVLVVDGSPDRSLEALAAALPATGIRAKVLELARNFGAFAAIRAGLIEAAGPYYAVMAADLQEPPELAREFFRELETDTCDVVFGVREGRDDPLASRAAATMFWAIYRGLVQPEMPKGGIDVFGCNQRARDALVAFDEAHSSLVGQLVWIGMRRAEVPYRRRARAHGASGWTLRKKLKYMLDSCLAFSDLPIRMLFGFGMLALAVALAFAAVVLVARLTGLISEPGYATTVLLIAGFGALNALGLSVVGAYAWRAFENTKGRPLAIVRQRYTFGEGAQP